MAVSATKPMTSAAPAKKRLRISRPPQSPLYILSWENGGELPAELQGQFTSVEIANAFVAKAYQGKEVPETFVEVESEDSALWKRMRDAKARMVSL